MSQFQIFSQAEIESLRKAGKILAACLKHCAAAVKPGMTTKELDKIAEEFIVSHNGARPAFKGYRNYRYTLCTSVNDECVHGLPSIRALKDGDIIAIDSGVIVDDLYTDACVSVAVGTISEGAKHLLHATEEALSAGIRKVRAGAHTGDISSAIHDSLLLHGFDAIRALTGHGLGTTLHQFPDIPNFGHAGKGPILPAGTIIAIEPISTTGSTEIREDEDGWTLRTEDGALSAHFEHTVLITEEGCEILT